MANQLCYNCMRELGERTNGVCPHCGYDNRTAAQTSPHALLLGTVLQNRYVIGRVLGQGGFGITYIGYDLKLETRVCIKEYFPDGAAWRSSEQSKLVSWGGSTNAVGLKQGRESFVKEARKAVRLRDISGVVQVWDVFYENETAYIVMSYVEGVNLKDYLMKELKRPLTPQECMNLMTPVIQGISEVHRNGIVHRDISPDNLMLRENRTLVLLDLGAAKDMTSGGGQSSQIVAKAGFSPPEQYVSGGNIGPWTDVYAMSATIYYCLTGKLPPTSVERFTGRNIDFSALPATLSNALQKGMELKVEDRWQNMNELYAALDAAAPDAVPAREIAHKQQTAAKTEATVLNHSSPGQANASVEDSGVSMKASEMKAQKGLSKVLVIAAICVAVIFGYFIMSGRKNPAVSKPAASQTEITSQSATSNSPMPTGFTEVGELKDLNTASVGDHVIFGSFEQDNNMANGKEPIEWLVLAKDENRILVISRYALDCQQYNTSRKNVTWETCSLRKWLNETFFNVAFSKEEQERIPNVTVSTDKNTSSGKNAGNSTTDQVFLLSILEAKNYFSSAEVRKCAPTDYAVAQGVRTSDSYKVNGRTACWWWLRSLGKDQISAASVYVSGSIYDSGNYFDVSSIAVRPALWLNYES